MSGNSRRENFRVSEREGAAIVSYKSERIKARLNDPHVEIRLATTRMRISVTRTDMNTRTSNDEVNNDKANERAMCF